jgi:hypothetical protein
MVAVVVMVQLARSSWAPCSIVRSEVKTLVRQ